MKLTNFTFKDAEDVELYVYKWIPDEDVRIKAVVQIAHGMAETAARYEHFAESLTREGYIVYANDHRGHGKTAKSLAEIGYIGEDGFNWMVEDLHLITRTIQNEFPELPVFLFGHSMGSFLTQQYMALHGDILRGAILCASNGKQGPVIHLGILIALLETKIKGARYKSNLLNQMSFGSYNKQFKPVRTEFDWLSRDSEEVDRYIKDPYCGAVFSASFFYDFFRGLKKLHSKQTLNRISKALPVYIISGDRDPVGGFGEGVQQLAALYDSIGMKDISIKLYKDARHELLHEINRCEVVEDTIAWLNQHI